MDGYRETLVRADLGDGRVIRVEARPAAEVGLAASAEVDVGLLDRLKSNDTMSFDGVTDAIEAIANRVTAALESAKPQRTTVEFGIDVAVESGGLTGLLAKGSGSAALKITLEWEGAQGAGGDHA